MVPLGEWGVRGVGGSCRSRDGVVEVGRKIAWLCEEGVSYEVFQLYILFFPAILIREVRHTGYLMFGASYSILYL